MPRTPIRSARLALGLALFLPGCSVLSKEPPVEVRWFVPTVSVPESQPTTAVVNLRKIQSSRPLRDEMVWWRSDVELAFDARHKWAEDPTETLARAMHLQCAALGVELTTVPGDASARVDLTRFGGRFEGSDGAVAEITLTIAYETKDLVRHERVVAEEPLQSDDPEELARGLGRALDRAAAEAAGHLQNWTR
ncbi:MAG: ABC-type transport auxiliary lipoprotein family protein [Planctomycetota bacterium]